MQDLHQFSTDVLLALAPVLAGWATLMIHRAVSWIKKKLAAQELWFYLDQLDCTAAIVVKSLMPQIDQLKGLNGKNKLTPQQIKAVQKEARELVKNQLAMTAREALTKAHQDLDQIIISHIEAAVFNIKSSRQ